MNDSYAFQRWQLSKALRDISGPYFVIGDNAYIQSRRVMTPFNNAELVDRPDRDSYNFHVSQLRIRIEMAFGLLVNKWRILKQPLFVRLRHCWIVISACMRLHNFCITQRCMTANTSPQQMLQSMARDVRSWNNQDPLNYEASDVEQDYRDEVESALNLDPSEVELDDGTRVNLMDEKVRSKLVDRIACRNLHRPELLGYIYLLLRSTTKYK
ncbi:hypothetical protein PHMEG_00032831 [Phytophthora megakarya]|uniref:DDE Tnp4 domain-containing protein n=1 Tax=Phytophthora megakarya TaxID=4795 RepID=A0A225UV79_9STRA|nr:hypothetical protein PHMEG_00032831 [Phytophthora megakarya]